MAVRGERVPDRLLVDVDADGRVSVVPWREGELPAGVAGAPQQLTWPARAGSHAFTVRAARLMPFGLMSTLIDRMRVLKSVAARAAGAARLLSCSGSPSPLPARSAARR